MRGILISLFALIISCNNYSKKNIHTGNVNYLEEELYSKVVEYQARYIVPKVDTDKGLYVYDVNFYKSGLDTIVGLTRSSAGIFRWPNQIIFGVYVTDKMYPTIVRDTLTFYSKKFVKKYIQDSVQLQKYKPKPNSVYSEKFPPVYKYKVSGNTLQFLGIDTVWSSW